VFDPRTTASALPLPNVLVYITTGAVDPLQPGVQCLVTSAPSGVVAYTNTAVDGSFELDNVPVNTSYTLVIQAGKWRRQFPVTVAVDPITAMALHMPANHNQGDMPLIAISTGSVDSLECVLRDMGVADTEFTDDNGTLNPGGHIHLYKGASSPGAYINASTPGESTLMNNAATLNGYDVVMFPCQGTPSGQGAQLSTSAVSNLLSYANAGGRVFATHYSYAWLEPSSPYNSQFPPVANWITDKVLANGPATINSGFDDGATLAQWLLNAKASTTYGQVALANVKQDFSSVIPPTQSWATLNAGGAITQMTFNTPVGAAAAAQCGRVLYNDYHVATPVGTGTGVFPIECSSPTTAMTCSRMLNTSGCAFSISSNRITAYGRQRAHRELQEYGADFDFKPGGKLAAHGRAQIRARL